MNPTNLAAILDELALIARKQKRLYRRTLALQQRLYTELYPPIPYKPLKYKVEHNERGWFVDNVPVSEANARIYMIFNNPVEVGHAI